MLAHNGPAFNAICAKCSKHKHAAWGVNRATKRCATSEETAYPIGLAKMIATCLVVALQAKGVQMPPQSIHESDIRIATSGISNSSNGAYIQNKDRFAHHFLDCSVQIVSKTSQIVINWTPKRFQAFECWASGERCFACRISQRHQVYRVGIDPAA